MLGPELVKNGNVVSQWRPRASTPTAILWSVTSSPAWMCSTPITSNDLGTSYGEALLEPHAAVHGPAPRGPGRPGTRRAACTPLSHVTGGGIAANLARVLPAGSWCEMDRATWSPLPVIRHLAELGGHDLGGLEGAWNMGVGMIAVVRRWVRHASVINKLEGAGISSWVAGRVSTQAERDFSGFEQGAKGVDGGAVRLTGGTPLPRRHKPQHGVRRESGRTPVVFCRTRVPLAPPRLLRLSVGPHARTPPAAEETHFGVKPHKYTRSASPRRGHAGTRGRGGVGTRVRACGARPRAGSGPSRWRRGPRRAP